MDNYFDSTGGNWPARTSVGVAFIGYDPMIFVCVEEHPDSDDGQQWQCSVGHYTLDEAEAIAKELLIVVNEARRETKL